MCPQMLQESRYILASRRRQDRFPALQEFGKRLQVAVVSLPGKGAKPFFHPEISLIVLQQFEIARTIHTPIIRATERHPAWLRIRSYLVHQRINFINSESCPPTVSRSFRGVCKTPQFRG